jgi:HK97 family phage major capsid protein
LAALVRVPGERFRGALERPEVAGVLLEDLAEGLALRADNAFLHGTGIPSEPVGIRRRVADGVHQVPAGADGLATARAVLTVLRGQQRTPFRNPGWLLHPNALDALTGVALPDGNPLDASAILQADGSDGGTFLGYPFVASEAAEDGQGNPTMYFSADWSEAWLGADRDLAAVDVSDDAAFERDAKLVRAVMRHDFALRRPNVFAFSP